MRLWPFGGREKSDQRTLENPKYGLTAEMLVAELDGILTGPDGVARVSTEQALRISAVRACVEAIADGVARMPLDMFERTRDGGRVKAVDHPVHLLVHRRPNREQSAFRFVSMLNADRALWGNGYAEIVRRPYSGDVVQLVRIHPRNVTVERVDGVLRYRVTREDGTQARLLSEDVVHVMGFSHDGLVGLSRIATARYLLAASLSAEKFNANFAQRALRPSGVLKVLGQLKEDALRRLRSTFDSANGGPDNAGRSIVLEQGQEWTPMTMPLEDAQWIQTMEFRVEEIARIFRVPPHKIGHLKSTPSGSIEQQDLAFLSDTLDPYAHDLEQELSWKLFLPSDRSVYYVEHNRSAVISMDAPARGNFYGALFRVGAMTIDEIRSRENLNNAPDGRGATHFVPSNMMPAPTQEQADQLMEKWISKGGGNAGGGGDQPGGPPRNPGQPEPEADDKNAQAD